MADVDRNVTQLAHHAALGHSRQQQGAVVVPQPPARGVPSRQSSSLSRNAQSLQHGGTVTRKIALKSKEEDYDGTEQSFVDLLMQKLREQVAQIGGTGATTSSRDDAMDTSGGLSAEVALQDRQTLWEAVEARNRVSLIRVLPVELMMLVFEFAPIGELCRMSCVSKRLAVIAGSPVLWVRFCNRYQLSYQRTTTATGQPAFVRQPKEVVRDYLVETRRALDERLRYESHALEVIEERLNQRVAMTAPFSSAFATESATEHPRLKQLIMRAEQQLSVIVEQAQQMEQARCELLKTSQTNRELLQRVQGQLGHITSTLLQQQAVEGGSDATAPSGGTFSKGLSWTASTSATSGVVASQQLPLTVPQGSLVRLNDVAFMRFERHVCQTIVSRITRDETDAGGAGASLPFVLRRGLSTFSAMELLVLQLTTGATSHPLSQGWSKWKRTFPAAVNGDYFNLRDCVSASEDQVLSIPKKLAPCAAMMRKVLSMQPAELESLIFGSSDK